MPLWGNTDDAANSTIFAARNVKVRANTANRNSLFGNTTADAFIPGLIVGQYGVDTTEIQITVGPVVDAVVTFPGSGYSSNSTVAFSANNTGSSAAANASVGATGRVSAVNFTNNGSGYTTAPIVTIAAPTAVTFNGSSAPDTTNDVIAISTANSKFLVGDYVLYKSTTGSVVGGLANNTQYYISFANTTTVGLSLTKGGANVDLTAAGSNDTGHSLTGETATAVATVGGAKNRGISHSGWNLRTEGTGGRAGRVQYETLVAMGSMSTDGSDDTVLPDA